MKPGSGSRRTPILGPGSAGGLGGSLSSTSPPSVTRAAPPRTALSGPSLESKNHLLLGGLPALASLSCAERVAAPAPAAVVAAKYPASTLPLSREHGYLQRAPAPDFWALIPHCAAQSDDVPCSLATLAMLVNGARQGTPLVSGERLVTQARLFERVRSDVWRRGLASGPTLACR